MTQAKVIFLFLLVQIANNFKLIVVNVITTVLTVYMTVTLFVILKPGKFVRNNLKIKSLIIDT